MVSIELPLVPGMEGAGRVVVLRANVTSLDEGDLAAYALSEARMPSTYPLSEDDAALIHAGAGGVGSFLVQMAKRRGARVIGTCSTEAKAALARSNGADVMILYTEVDFEQETLRITDGRGGDLTGRLPWRKRQRRTDT